MLRRLGALGAPFDCCFVALFDHLRLDVMLSGCGTLLRPLDLNCVALLGHRGVLRVIDRGRVLYPAFDRQGVSID